MSFGTGLIVLGLLSGAPASDAGVASPVQSGARPLSANASERPQTYYEVRIIHTPAIPWRNTAYKDCQRVGRSGISTVWLLNSKTWQTLVGSLQQSPHGNLVMAPRITSFDGAEATISTGQTVPYVADVERVVTMKDGRLESLKFNPIAETCEEVVTVKVTGKTDQKATELQLGIQSRWICNIIQSTSTETFVTSSGKSSITAPMQLPQIVDANVAGKFTVPTDHHLLVSLGTATVVVRDNQPVVMERLALITPKRVITESEESRTGRTPPTAVSFHTGAISSSVTDAKVARSSFDAAPRQLPVAVANAPKLTPKVPSRSLPGPAGLPPLPDEAVKATALHTVPAPQASAQIPNSSSAAEPNSPTYAQMLRRDPNIVPAAVEPAPIAVATSVATPKTNAPTVSQMLRRDPNVITAASEPVPVGVSRLLPPTTTASEGKMHRDPNVAATAYEMPSPDTGRKSSGFTIPFLGRVTIDIDIQIK